METRSGFPNLPDWLDLEIIVPVSATVVVICVGILVVCVALSRRKQPGLPMNPEEYAQFYGAMNTMNGRMVTMRKDGLPYEEMGYVPPPNRKLPPVPGPNQQSNYNTIDRIKKGKSVNGDVYGRPSYATLDPRKQGMSHQYEGMPQYDEIPYGDGPGPRGPIPEVPVDYAQVPAVPMRQVGGSMAGQDEDISPYATFHLLGMREENAKNGNPNNFQTMPNGMNGMNQQGPNTNPNTPAHQRQMLSQTMNPRRSMPGQPGPGMQVYDSPNCDYEAANNYQQNFGNPYDCPEGFYNASLMSSVGYSQVQDHQNVGVPMLPGQIIQQQMANQQMMNQQMNQRMVNQQIMNQQMNKSMNGELPPTPHAEYSTDTVIYKGGPPPAARGPLPHTEDEFPPPPPLRSADTSLNGSSLNDSNSTTQSNVTSECSEAECDREPLVKDYNRASAAAIDPAKELSTEEMRKLIERNEIVQTNGLKPYDTVNV